MALPQGINFRNTLGFVTDISPESAEIGATSFTPPTYPRTTAQGNNVGWETSGDDCSGRNDNSAIDRRLAGCHFADANESFDFRIDLPSAGDYNVRIAAGRDGYTINTKVELFDTSSSLGVLASGSTNAFRDATNVARTAAAWPGSNVAAAKTFTTTICRFRIGQASVEAAIAHVYIEAAAGGGVTRTPLVGSAAYAGVAPTDVIGSILKPSTMVKV